MMMGLMDKSVLVRVGALHHRVPTKVTGDERRRAATGLSNFSLSDVYLAFKEFN